MASSSLSGVTKAKTRTSFPVPCGRLTTPRTIWSALRGSTPSLTARSTDSSNFELAISLTSAEASCTEYSFVRSILLSDSLRFFVIFMADSTVNAFKSCILSSAIARTCSQVTLATLARLGSPDPFLTLAASIN